MIERVIRVFRLDPTVFREVAEDQNAMTEAAIVVVVVTLLSAIGGAVGALIGGASIGGVIVGFIAAWILGVLFNWILWAVVTYFVGTTLFQGKTDIPEMMRVLGYANAPSLLGILGIIPCLGWIAGLIGLALSLIAAVIAIREAMEFDTTKAIVTAVIGWIIIIILGAIRVAVLGV
jgi:hypothetical protein